MPRGVPNKKPQAPELAPEPFIMITPAEDGQLRLNAYSMDAAEVIRNLRLAIVHLVATANGIDEVFSGSTVVLATPAPPSTNGTKPPPKKQAPRTTTRRKRAPREIVVPEDDVDEEGWEKLPDESDMARIIASQAGSHYG